VTRRGGPEDVGVAWVARLAQLAGHARQQFGGLLRSLGGELSRALGDASEAEFLQG
jgi:hypothetical protein